MSPAPNLTFDQLRDLILGSTEPELDDDGVYEVTKSNDEKRYTLGVMYVPGVRDSDNEYANADELQRACWDFVRKGSKRVRDTHTATEIGDLVELISWPFPTEAEMSTGDGKVVKRKLPAGTVYAGVVWDEKVWPLVKSGKLRGYSMGGKAVRVRDAATDDKLPKMASLTEEKVTKDGPPIPNKPGKTNWVEDAGGLPPYIEKIARDLIATHGTSGAIRLAVGAVKRWARGGGDVKPDTRAKAQAALAQWEAMKAKAHVTKGEELDPIEDDLELDLAELLITEDT
jgi:hypothetical protein